LLGEGGTDLCTVELSKRPRKQNPEVSSFSEVIADPRGGRISEEDSRPYDAVLHATL